MANQAVVKDTAIHVGDTVRVHYRIIESEKVSGKTKREVHEEKKERIQVFEGIVIAIKGSGNNLMFTVRRVGVGNIGIERIFPAISPWIKKIEVKKRGSVRRAKLYYLRKQTGRKATKIAEKLTSVNVPTPISQTAAT